MEDPKTFIENYCPGRFSRKFLANDKNGRKFFLKYMAKDKFEFFINERNILRAHKHTNIVNLLDARWTEKGAWMYLEFCRYGSLDEIRKVVASGFPESTIQFILKESLSALAFLHRRGIIHRNVSTKSLLVTEEGWIKLTDFTMAVYRHPMVAEPYRPNCMSFQSGYYELSTDLECDVYSLGTVALLLYTGRSTAKFNDTPSNELTRRFRDFVNLCHEKFQRRRSSSMLLDHEFLKEGVSKMSMMKLLELYEENSIKSGRTKTIEMKVMKIDRSGGSESELCSSNSSLNNLYLEENFELTESEDDEIMESQL